MQISKTDFMEYTRCPNSFWLLKHKPSIYPHGEFSAFAQKIASEGYEVEKYVQKMLGGSPDAAEFSFQEVFETGDGLFTRADAVYWNEDGSIDIYEVKSSTSVKEHGGHNQIKDTAFQKIVAEKSGLRVGRALIVHLNGEYKRQGEINPHELLTIVDVTRRVEEVIQETEHEVQAALNTIAMAEIDENSCTCLYLTKSNHCDAFDYFNPDIPKPSIYNLPRISKKRIEEFVDDGRFGLDEISLDEVTDNQAAVLTAAHQKSPVINQRALADWFSKSKYPLYFLDYETYASAIPIVEEAQPQKPIPFQYSLHVKRTPEDTEMAHFEYLADEAALPRQMIEHMQANIGPEGSVVSWHASFENTQNRTMALLYPDKADFLYSLIERTVDLEDLFKGGYVDINFDGSTSIKKVLPVLAANLTYEEMAVGNGTDAMEAWQRLISLEPGVERERLKADMFEYCKLDTYAMVRIFEEMERV